MGGAVAVVEPNAFLDEIDTGWVARTSARDAVEQLRSSLADAGPRYPWTQLVPGWIQLALHRMRDGTDPTSADLRLLVAAAQRGARDWVPLYELEQVCEIVVTCLWRRLWESLDPKMCTALLGVGAWASAAVRGLVTALRLAYFDETSRLGGDRRADDLIISAMLDGGDARGVARALGVAPPEPFGVIVVDPVGGDGETLRFGGLPRLVEAVLGETPGALCALVQDRARLVALIPVPSVDAATAVPLVHEIAERLAVACQSVHDRDFAAGLALSEGVAGGGAAFAEAIGVVELLVRAGLPQRTAFLEEVVVEALLADHQGLRKRLTDWVAGLSDRPELRDTLRALYCGGLDRGRTARRLGIHRSTLDHRLGRIERLTAVSPTTPRGVLLLSAALAAWRLDGDIGDIGPGRGPSGRVVRHSLDEVSGDPAFSQ